MEKKKTKKAVRFIDFDGGRDYRAWLVENFPSKMDSKFPTSPSKENPNSEA